MLGFAGRMVGGGERLDHYTTKVGGAPDWPPARAAAADATGADCSSEPPEAMTACDACGTQMALVVQAHAPLTSGELPDGALAPDRTLYLMTCFHPACPRAGANASRWKCLRAQRRDNAAVTAANAAANATLAPDPAAAPSTAPADAREGAAVGAVGVRIRIRRRLGRIRRRRLGRRRRRRRRDGPPLQRARRPRHGPHARTRKI